MDVWPDNILSVNVFISAATQWRIGMAGPTGLDYPALESVLRLERIPRKDWPGIFDAVKVMEDEALSIMRKSRK